jgi:hypothetical protein
MPLADDVGQAGTGDRLHEAVLIAARHPDQGRPAQLRRGVGIGERDRRRLLRSRLEPHLHGRIAGVRERGRLRQDRDDRGLSPSQRQGFRHDLRPRPATPDDHE